MLNDLLPSYSKGKRDSNILRVRSPLLLFHRITVYWFIETRTYQMFVERYKREEDEWKGLAPRRASVSCCTLFRKSFKLLTWQVIITGSHFLPFSHSQSSHLPSFHQSIVNFRSRYCRFVKSWKRQNLPPPKLCGKFLLTSSSSLGEVNTNKLIQN